MMLKKSFLALMAFPALVSAQELSLDAPLPMLPLFDQSGFVSYGPGVPLSEFLRIAFSDLSGRSYAVAPDVDAKQLISADLSKTKLSGSEIVSVVSRVLESVGLSIVDHAGVLIVEKSKNSDAVSGRVSVYSPSHRSIEEIQRYFKLFPSLTFALPDSLSGSSGSSTTSGSTLVPTGGYSSQHIVMRGVQHEIDSFLSLMKTVDVAVPQVLLRTYVIEVRDTRGHDSAVSLVASLLGGRVGVSLGGTAAPSGDAIKLLSGASASFELSMSSLFSDSSVRLVSAPTLRASDASTSQASIGTETPTLGSVVVSQGGTQQSITYQKSGVILNFSPRIYEDSIRMHIFHEVSSFARTETGLSDTPTKLSRSFSTDVVLQDGESVLLGGLSESATTKASRKSWSFFGSDASSDSSSQIVVLIRADRIQ